MSERKVWVVEASSARRENWKALARTASYSKRQCADEMSLMVARYGSYKFRIQKYVPAPKKAKKR